MIPSLEETERENRQPGIAAHVANGTFQIKRGSGLFVWVAIVVLGVIFAVRSEKLKHKGNPAAGDEAGLPSSFAPAPPIEADWACISMLSAR